jgi:hypothetical protein
MDHFIGSVSNNIGGEKMFRPWPEIRINKIWWRKKVEYIAVPNTAGVFPDDWDDGAAEGVDQPVHPARYPGHLPVLHSLHRPAFSLLLRVFEPVKHLRHILYSPDHLKGPSQEIYISYSYKFKWVKHK